MAKTVANLNIQIGATTATLRRDLGNAQNAVRQFGRGAQASAANVQAFQASIRSTVGYLLKFAAAAAAFRAIKFGITLAAEAETAEIAFRTMLGSAEQAKKTIGDIRAFAAATPFQTDDLISASRSLIAFGESADTVVGTLRRIGDVSAGVSAPIGEIATLYGKARVQGRLFAEDINQLTGRGIPIIQELAKQFGVADSEIKKLVETGRIRFSNLEEAFRSLTAEGGKFFGLTAAQSKSLSGVISTLKDNIALLALEIGNKALPLLKSMANAALSLTETIRGLDADTVRNTAKWVAFGAALSASLVIIPKIVAAVRTIIVAIRALATATAVAQALGGPAGWATLAASLTIAAGAAVAVGKAFDGITESAGTATTEAKTAIDAVSEATAALPEKLDEVKTSIDGVSEATDKWAAIGDRIRDSVKTPTDRLRDSLAEIAEAWRRGVIDVGTYAAAVRKVRDDLADLGGAAMEAMTPPTVGAAVRGTASGAAAVSESARALKAIAEESRKELASAKRRERLLDLIYDELAEIRRKTVPVTVKEVAIL